jgi:ABC-type Fe3+/spermidine/putrescine transport system ATPase subunit
VLCGVGQVLGSAVAAVRPERLRLGVSDENNLTGTVVAMAYHGLDLQLHVQTTAAPKPIILRLTAELAEAQNLTIGDTVSFGWAAKDTRIFPA